MINAPEKVGKGMRPVGAESRRCGSVVWRRLGERWMLESRSEGHEDTGEQSSLGRMPRAKAGGEGRGAAGGSGGAGGEGPGNMQPQGPQTCFYMKLLQLVFRKCFQARMIQAVKWAVCRTKRSSHPTMVSSSIFLVCEPHPPSPLSPALAAASSPSLAPEERGKRTCQCGLRPRPASSLCL